MKRAILLVAGWVFVTASLYSAALLLDVYWNLVHWRPRLDWIAGGLLIWMAAAISGLWLLARANLPAVPRAAALLACLVLLAAGLNALPAESRGEGLLGRDRPSPTWYRVARLTLLTLPTLGWASSLKRTKA